MIFIDDKLYEIIRKRLDDGAETISWLCKHVAQTEAVMGEMRGDLKEIKELCLAQNSRLSKAENKVKYLEGKVYVVFTIFIIIIGAFVTKGMM